MAKPKKAVNFAVLLGAASALFLLSLIYAPLKAEAAASLYLSPASGGFTVGSTFTVSLYLNTGGNFVNALEADLSFPPDKLQVVSPTAGKSLIQVWINQPTYDNAYGTLKFQGAVTNPGINTEAGLISTVTFRVKNAGQSVVKILDSSKVFLNDGRGTDILGQTTDGLYYLTLPPPAGPTVISPTNPDQEKWYATKTVILRWDMPADSEGVSYMLDQDPVNVPDNISEGPKDAVSYSNLADGVYYFHIRRLRAGVWGGETDYAIHIDNSPPAAFKINFSPGNYTSNHRPIIDFGTTDAVSGLDHYELKIIPLDAPIAQASQSATPFFIEVTPPYSTNLNDGRYQVVARAYDQAGNYYQAEDKLTIARPFFEIIAPQGVNVGGAFTVGWPYVAIIAFVMLVLIIYLSRLMWGWHREVEEKLEHGPAKYPSIVKKLGELKEKQKEYGLPRQPLRGDDGKINEGGGGKGLMALMFLFAGATAWFFAANGKVALADMSANVPLEPPIVTLAPQSISNDEILYLGGRSNAPSANVLIRLQNVESGAVVNQAAETDKTGVWFYSFPQFLEAGHYIIWTQLKVGDELSSPSSKLDLTVAPTAIQIGGNRLSYQDVYLMLFLLFAAAFAALLVYSLYHGYHFKVKSGRLRRAIGEAEESVRRGFSVLRHDIESELALIRKMKLNKELSAEEKLREEKLLKDLDEVNRYIGKEIWRIERES